METADGKRGEVAEDRPKVLARRALNLGALDIHMPTEVHSFGASTPTTNSTWSSYHHQNTINSKEFSNLHVINTLTTTDHIRSPHP